MKIRKETDELKRRLKGIEIHEGPEYRYAYSYDATGRRGDCSAVVFPRSAEDLALTVRECHALGVPLFMRGAGTGFSGGSIPSGGGVVVSTEKMDRILSFDPALGESVEVESGIVNKALQDALEREGYFYPPDPASLKVSTIGGNIIENAGGPRAFKYGVTRRYVRSLTWIDAAGKIRDNELEGPAALLPGSEGTLGVVYSARLTILPLPRARRAMLLSTTGDRSAIEMASLLLASGACPSVMEFIDSNTMMCVSEYRQLSGLDAGESFLFIEVDGSPGEVGQQTSLIEDLSRKEGMRITAARDESERELLWDLRRSISPSLARKGITKVNEDVSLPLGSLPDIIAYIAGRASALDLDCYVYGHCGDGNLHVNIMTDRRLQDEMKKAWQFVDDLFAEVVRLGGALSGEHGVGTTKDRYLGLQFSSREITLQAGLRRAMDPDAFLNPGKYFRDT